MKNSKKATSILEAMIVLLIIVVWITWLYNIFNESIKLSNTTKNRIEAIEIAREWIEAMKNIRDTNWLMYGSDIKNCFNTLNYDSKCVWKISLVKYIWNIWDITKPKSYKIYQNSVDYKWYLKEENTLDFKKSTYRDKFRIYKDTNWYYTQTWSISEKTIFTRELQISYSGSTDLIKAKVVVWWADGSKSWYHKVELEDLITNWKQN
jgi:hypothetical protein